MIHKPRHLFNLNHNILVIVPTCASKASLDPNWHQAMSDEYNALLDSHTWDLVPHHPSMNLVDCKWVFQLKEKSDGSIERYKARLVAQDFKQQLGIDYNETFNPVIKPPTVHLILSLAFSKRCIIRQLNVKNVFLHGDLQELVYMKQSSGFVHPDYPNHVCRLKKSLYSLKKVPRVWFH